MRLQLIEINHRQASLRQVLNQGLIQAKLPSSARTPSRTKLTINSICCLKRKLLALHLLNRNSTAVCIMVPLKLLNVQALAASFNSLAALITTNLPSQCRHQQPEQPDPKVFLLTIRIVTQRLPNQILFIITTKALSKSKRKLSLNYHRANSNPLLTVRVLNQNRSLANHNVHILSSH